MYSVLDSVGTDGILITFGQKLAELLNNLAPNGWPVGNLILVLIALVLSVVLCGVVGIERELRGRRAGLRTHLLVGVGSCLIMIISIYGFPAMFGEKRDVARLAAQIITGVGFLGAGAIIHHNSGIKGLTTAGTIWVAMAIGIACGSLNFILAIAATLIIMFVLVTIRKFEVKINNKKPYIVISAPMSESLLEKIILVSKEYECSVQGLASEVIEDEKGKRVEVSFQAVFTCAKPNISEYVAKLEKETNAINVQLFGHKA
ncbi:MgtC/SapB family protein [Candidatus Saccharibacteria bacterium]|nr:MgtC/SapB family protein [Candidatus Saccharibacteria bacterium]